MYVRAELYRIDCHGRAMKMYHCARENTTDFSWAQNCVSDSDGSRTVSVSSKEPDQNRWNCFVHIALSYSTRWRDCLPLLNAGDSVWQLLWQGYITWRGRWVLTLVYEHAHLALYPPLNWQPVQEVANVSSDVVTSLLAQYDTRRWI